MEASSLAHIASDETPHIARKTENILIIDEDPILRGDLSSALQSAGFATRQSPYPTLLLTKMETLKPNLVVCEVRPESMSAFELLAALRSHGSDVPVVLLFHENQPSLRVTALERGASDALNKPIVAEELVARVRLQLRQAARLRQLAELAHIDELTGILNRRGLIGQMNKAIARASRESQPLSLLLINLDDFKSINDRRGHAVGDQVLKNVARALSETVREEDVVARLGGDEFVVLLPNTDRTAALQVANRVESAIKVRASIGVATPDVDDFSTDELLGRADRLMYIAKRQRKLAAI